MLARSTLAACTKDSVVIVVGIISPELEDSVLNPKLRSLSLVGDLVTVFPAIMSIVRSKGLVVRGDKDSMEELKATPTISVEVADNMFKDSIPSIEIVPAPVERTEVVTLDMLVNAVTETTEAEFEEETLACMVRVI